MFNSRGMKAAAVLAFIFIFTVGLATVSFAQFGQKLGVQGPQPSGDLSQNSQGDQGTSQPASSFGVKNGMQGPQSSGDLATNSAKQQ